MVVCYKVLFICIEDVFLCLFYSGCVGEFLFGFLVDYIGVYFDGIKLSDIEILLVIYFFDDVVFLNCVCVVIECLKEVYFIKYSGFDIEFFVLESGYVFVIDQICNDVVVCVFGVSDVNF